MNAFSQLQLEKERTLFMFYGYRMAATGGVGGGYFKLANSLNEALSDLSTNEGIADEGGYLVRDAFLVMEDGDPSVHVELISVNEIRELAQGADDDPS